MADVFISYSQVDKERVRPIVKALEGAGYEVWWDPEIRAGTAFRKEIETELEKASCVIVVWSKTSRESDFVCDEAERGRERDVLVPVWIDKVRPPLGFGSVHVENLVGWDGGPEADPWQRVMLQVSALAGEREPAVPQPHGEPPGPAVEIQPAAPRPPAETEKAKSGSSLTLIFTLIAVAALAASYIFGNQQELGIIGTTVALAATTFILFRFAEADLSPHMKALAKRWLLPEKGRVEVNTAEAFNAMFEAVFGPKHFTWMCFWRSALASTIALPVFVYAVDTLISSINVTNHFLSMLERNSIEAATAFAIFAAFNVFGDYLSLLETRILLGIAAKKQTPLLFAIIIDAVLTFVIFAGSTILIASLVAVGISLLTGDSTAYFFTTGLWITANETLLSFNKNEVTITLWAGLATAYLTSVWLWMTALYAPLARLLMWSRTTGLTWLGRLFDTRHQPFTALGYLTALMILITGGGIWLATSAMALAN